VVFSPTEIEDSGPGLPSHKVKTGKRGRLFGEKKKKQKQHNKKRPKTKK